MRRHAMSIGYPELFRTVWLWLDLAVLRELSFFAVKICE